MIRLPSNMFGKGRIYGNPWFHLVILFGIVLIHETFWFHLVILFGKIRKKVGSSQISYGF